MSDDDGGPASFFDGHPVAFAVFERVRRILEELGPTEIRTTKSQVAFRRHHGFAWLWLPGQYLRAPAAPVVLSIALGRHDGSPRFKEVVHPSPRHWMHHLEIDDPDAVDDKVAGWLREAADRAG
jgi:hypothetical protein